jgi:ATP adenylyltransferase
MRAFAVSYEQIWAPWRLEYIQGAKGQKEPDPGERKLVAGGTAECFLCCAAADAQNPARLVVHRTAHCLTVLNRYPYNNGHLLVAPLHHRSRLDELAPQEQADLAEEITRMVGLLESVMHPEGFNVGLNLGRVAGAGLPGHLHWHLVPRWNGDTNFMPVTAGVNVIPQSLAALWEALTGALGGSSPS